LEGWHSTIELLPQLPAQRQGTQNRPAEKGEFGTKRPTLFTF
jgi:hypothetical protein